MGRDESLLALERRLWNADEDTYRDVLAEEAVMVFPEPTGVLERAEILESVASGDRWRRVEFTGDRTLEVDDGVVQLVYEARAERREGGSTYEALVTSTYVREDGSWKLTSHQQTPTSG
jgi:hypothetical protein